jgi:FkbM family methyltransferase
MAAMQHSISEAGRRSAKLARLVRVPAYRQALRHGVAATVEHERVPFGAARTVIDVGAGRGQFALFASRRFPGATIHSFEPLPSSFVKASQALDATPAVELRQVAVSSEAGTADLHVTADGDSSSLRAPTAEQTRQFPGTLEVKAETVEVRTLDELLPSIESPALLKLDLQGGELDALKGATELLGQIDEVFAECSFVELYEGQPLAGDVIQYLGGHGYDLKGMFSPSYGEDGTCIQADLLFRRA